MQAQWRNEKQVLGTTSRLRDELDQARRDYEEAERRYNHERAAELRYGRIPGLEKQLKEAQAKLKAAGGTLLREEVTDEEIAEVVSRWAGVPVRKLMAGEREKLLHLDASLTARVIGQDTAVAAVADAVLRARAGIQNSRRPVGAFLFLGPTGVGKTELARSLAAELFDAEENMVRIDMSEYMEKHSVSRLVGAPPGYIGYEEGGQLTEAVRRKPYSVILLDEIEKAHPDVFNILLQVLDDGRLTDGHGRTVNFRNAIVILTSNIGSEYLAADRAGTTDAEGRREISDQTRAQVMETLKRAFRPEFLNRLDEVVLFHPLGRPQVARIVALQIEDLRRRLARQEIKLEVTPEGLERIAELGYDPIYGARPVKRVIQRELETAIARRIVAGECLPESTVTVSADATGITIQ
jgi:ATP-dependent Clp protease ATP-binding subunit ClpB